MNTELSKGLALVHNAGEFAREMHREQVRKYTGDPYITHPQEVARIVSKTAGHTADMLAAALLHDVVEDCDCCVAQIEALFGKDVAYMVERLTDYGHECGNRSTRKAMDVIRLGKANGDVQTIKLADLISNTRSIVEYDPNFAVLYMKEKAMLLPHLKKGDAKLWDVVGNTLESYYAGHPITDADFQQGGRFENIL